jgi:hypothetical protein
MEPQTGDGVPEPTPAAASPEPVSDRDRVAVIARLHDLVASGDLGLEQFSASLEQVLAADSETELETAVVGLPSIVRLTPSWRKLSQPVVLDAGIYRLELGGGWQLGADTTVKTNTAKVRLDLTEATWDARDVQLHLQSGTGNMEVIVPRGVSVQVVSMTGRVITDDLAPPLPGGPVLRVDVATKTGKVRFTHERPSPRAHRWGRKRGGA